MRESEWAPSVSIGRVGTLDQFGLLGIWARTKEQILFGAMRVKVKQQQCCDQ